MILKCWQLNFFHWHKASWEWYEYFMVIATNFNKLDWLSSGKWVITLWHPYSKFQNIRVGRKPNIDFSKYKKNANILESRMELWLFWYHVSFCAEHSDMPYLFQWQHTRLTYSFLYMFYISWFFTHLYRNWRFEHKHSNIKISGIIYEKSVLKTCEKRSIY